MGSILRLRFFSFMYLLRFDKIWIKVWDRSYNSCFFFILLSCVELYFDFYIHFLFVISKEVLGPRKLIKIRYTQNDCKFVYLTKIVFSTYLVRCEKSRLYIKPSDMLNPMMRNSIASTIFSIFLKIYMKPSTNMRGLSSLVSQNFLCRTRKVDVSTKKTLWWYP